MSICLECGEASSICDALGGHRPTLSETISARIRRRRDAAYCTNKFQGLCLHCSTLVPAGAGWAVRLGGRWRVKHQDCNEAAEERHAVR